METLKSILKSQYHATLAMLRQAIEACPDEMWLSKEHPNSFWQIAYHTLFYAHFYIQPNETAFSPWEHQSEAQHPDAIGGPPDPHSNLPLIPAPYSKAEVLDYWSICERMVDNAIDVLDLESQQSGFPWYKMPKLEHQIVNIRHIQHHVAQLGDRLRSSANIGVKWVGGVRTK